MVNSDVTTIQLSKDTRDQLKEIGKKGETYDEIILKLIQKNKSVKNNEPS